MPAGFSWQETDGTFSDLSYQDRPVLRYVHYPFDDSTPAKRERTFKVFHHLYDPAGKRLVTNDGPPSLFPHHRGIFFGFNKVTYGDGKKADVFKLAARVHTTSDIVTLLKVSERFAPKRLITVMRRRSPRRPVRSSEGTASRSPGTARRRRSSPSRNAS